MSRRQFGTIRRLSSGRWQVRYRTGSGGRVTAPGTFATRTEASRWLATIEAGQGRDWTDPNAGRVWLSDYCWEWLDGRARLAPRTREIYRHQLSHHVLPRIADGVPPLGSVRLDRLTPELLRVWYAALRGAKGDSVAAKAYVRLRQVLKQAVDDDRIARNPCRIEGGGVERHPEQPTTGLLGLDGLSFHEMRHTAGTLAAPTGATTKELMARLGHSSTRAAMIYQHASAERDRRIAERLAEMVNDERRRSQNAAPQRIPAGGAQLGHEAARTGREPPPERAKGARDQHFR